jgi:hypothetical protein
MPGHRGSLGPTEGGPSVSAPVGGRKTNTDLETRLPTRRRRARCPQWRTGGLHGHEPGAVAPLKPSLITEFESTRRVRSGSGRGGSISHQGKEPSGAVRVPGNCRKGILRGTSGHGLVGRPCCGHRTTDWLDVESDRGEAIPPSAERGGDEDQSSQANAREEAFRGGDQEADLEPAERHRARTIANGRDGVSPWADGDSHDRRPSGINGRRWRFELYARLLAVPPTRSLRLRLLRRWRERARVHAAGRCLSRFRL